MNARLYMISPCISLQFNLLLHCSPTHSLSSSFTGDLWIYCSSFCSSFLTSFKSAQTLSPSRVLSLTILSKMAHITPGPLSSLILHVIHTFISLLVYYLFPQEGTDFSVLFTNTYPEATDWHTVNTVNIEMNV